MWKRKVSPDEKKQNARKRMKIKIDLDPDFTCEEEVHAFCDKYEKTMRVRKFLLRKSKGDKFITDMYTDYRSVPKNDQVPSSSREPLTPPGFWSIKDRDFPDASVPDLQL